ncbi:uncharacterized protein PGTG_07423 [Puccinia graminis f. sp. tritici CRL 75-36-700-3]|uniref:Uncharacterized protein n=1 Tax=Puccinia graminis f. sp. tritici (strain CRL 75-36-700-3 / race SCCL) TaxID=418459 RepID=E3K9Z2_PUCGT|nr:uncharacterized protein PGTG_07423 [Puccinia graminis f. sp. tritici CRL 75-36-700-3]EFP81171.2 hypothetical protein PGTG_07423 [Puccinia graminis f. sp. tritici CRL 75-36-700-3]
MSSMSDYVPTETESERETREETRSPEPRLNHQNPRQTQAPPSRTGPIRNTTHRNGRLPGQSYPPLRGSVAAAAAFARQAGRPTAAPTQPTRSGRAALIPSVGAAERLARRSVPPLGDVADPGEVRVDASTGFPNGIIDLTHLDEPVNEEYVQELEGLFELRRGYAAVGESLAYVAPPRQHATHLYSQLAILQAIERYHNAVLAVPRAAALPEVTPANQAQQFQYAPVFKDFVKRKARELLMTKNLKVYGSDLPRGAPATLKSLLVLVLDHINAQPTSFKREYLPRGYADGDPGAVASVDSLVRNKLRKSRGMMRDLLLTNIQAPAGREITLPIPTASALMVNMRTSMTPPIPNSTAVVAPDPQEARGNQTHLKARLAYLRILTVMQLVGRGPRDAGRQWRNIDEHLRHLEAMGRDYRTVFFRLILRLDRALFNGDQFFLGIDTSTIKLPTNQEVEDLMAAAGEGVDHEDATLAEP